MSYLCLGRGRGESLVILVPDANAAKAKLAFLRRAIDAKRPLAELVEILAKIEDDLANESEMFIKVGKFDSVRNVVQLLIDAPRDMPVHRKEVWDRENRAS